MTQTLSGGIEALRAAMSGPVIGPIDLDYDEARKVWNADVDRRPAVIAKCASPADVGTAIAFATEQGLEIAVRSGAHSMSGASVVDDGLVIDLSQLRQVTVDPDAKRARVGGGALLADLDAATYAHSLAVPAGLVSHTGVAGLTLGGGMGWLTRQAGLSIDNLVSAQVVTADGRILRAAENENPDLFWAIRGGGGNFGVVTEFEFCLHEVGPIVQLGLLFWGLEQGPEVLRLAREVIATLPRTLNIVIAGLNAPPAPFVPDRHHLQPGYALMVTGFGPAEEHDLVLARIREALPPLFEFVAPMPYVALQQMLDESNAWGFHCYDKGTYIEDLSDVAIEVITEQLPRKSSPLSLLLFYRLDEAYSEVDENDSAFSGGRSPRFAVFIIGVCPTPELLVADRAWVRSFWDALRPYTPGIGCYVNAMTEFEEDRVRAAYGAAKYERLTRIKSEYDPGNVFHRNVNIKPA
ncbi:MAG: FAD-binding oxidoreductase [Pseudonocardiaceae bacterium]